MKERAVERRAERLFDSEHGAQTDSLCSTSEHGAQNIGAWRPEVGPSYETKIWGAGGYVSVYRDKQEVCVINIMSSNCTAESAIVIGGKEVAIECAKPTPGTLVYDLKGKFLRRL